MLGVILVTDCVIKLVDKTELDSCGVDICDVTILDEPILDVPDVSAAVLAILWELDMIPLDTVCDDDEADIVILVVGTELLIVENTEVIWEDMDDNVALLVDIGLLAICMLLEVDNVDVSTDDKIADVMLVS